MNKNNDSGDGICILSLDSGGPGTYSQLLILKECMNRLASDLQLAEEDIYPADYFDLMGGVGFGGFVAIMLGLFRMGVDEVIEGLLNVVSTVFPEEPQDTVDPVMNMKNLKEAVEGLLQTRNVPPDAKINEITRTPTRCKVALFAATSANIAHPQVFRAYSSRGSSLNPTLVDAICATMATPSHFSPVKIGPRMRQQSFVGGALGSHNPTRLLLDEASIIFGKDRRLAQVISLGCGLPRVLSIGSADEPNVHRALKEITADCETLAHELSTRLFNVDAYARLNVDRGMESNTMDDWSVLGDIESHTTAYLGSAWVSMSVENSLRHLQERIANVTLGQISHSSSVKVTAKRAPAVSPHYVVRKKPWEVIVRYLVADPSSRPRILPITGMGGCGKTQMVSYFLQEHGSLYKRAVYVDASSLSSIKADLQTWARTLGDGHEHDTWEDALRTLSSVPQGEQWALILDNADDPKLDLAPFLPTDGSLTVIITSRNRNTGNLSTTFHLELGEMNSDEALATLVQAARRQLPLSVEEQKSAQEIMKELGCLAVALVQAGTYCYEMSSSSQGVFCPYKFTQYLSLFSSHRSELMKKAEPSSLDGYRQGVYTTLDLSYQALPQQTRDFLHLICFFYHTDIPLEALAAAAKNSFAVNSIFLPYPKSHEVDLIGLKNLFLTDGRWNEMQVQEIIRTLRSFSLVSVTSLGDSLFLQLHPLIQSWSRDMTSTVSGNYRAMAIQVLTACGGEESFNINLLILPHVLDILDQIQLEQLHVNNLMALGKVLKQQGRYRRALKLYEAGLEILKGSTLSEEINTLAVSGNIADMYLYEGRWSEAEKLLQHILQRYRVLLGEERQETTVIAGNLASTFHYQGRSSEAEKLRLEVLEQRRRNPKMGTEHPYTIMAASDLASTYTQQGRWNEAEKLQVEVLEHRTKLLGLDHPDTVTASANLANTYLQQGRYANAELLLVEVFKQRQRILGREHPDTIWAAADLGATYFYQGRWTEAEQLEAEVLEQRQRILGMEHLETIWAASNLGATYCKQSKWGEGLEHLVQSVQLSMKVIGREHHITQQRIGYLRDVYTSLGREQEAQDMESLLLPPKSV